MCKAKTDVDGLISELVQANLGQRDELFIPSKALQLLEAIHPGIHQQYMKHRNNDPDGKLAVILNNTQPPRDSDNKVPIPRQYTAPLEKEQQTINVNLATAEDNDDTSNELENTYPDLEDQLDNQNEQVHSSELWLHCPICMWHFSMSSVIMNTWITSCISLHEMGGTSPYLIVALTLGLLDRVGSQSMRQANM